MSVSAKGKHISFRPFSLFEKASAWGADQSPALNPSVVVCLAVREFLARRGVQIEDAAPDVEADLVNRVRELSRTVGPQAVGAKLDELSLATADTAGGGK